MFFILGNSPSGSNWKSGLNKKQQTQGRRSQHFSTFLTFSQMMQASNVSNFTLSGWAKIWKNQLIGPKKPVGHVTKCQKTSEKIFSRFSANVTEWGLKGLEKKEMKPIALKDSESLRRERFSLRCHHFFICFFSQQISRNFSHFKKPPL